jgi:hypothetical protein
MPQVAMACSRSADAAVVPMPRTLAALLAGAVAIALNIGALAAADLVPLATAHGGLLRLLVVLPGDALPIPAGSAFQAGFHIVVGRQWRCFMLWSWNLCCEDRAGYAD